MKNNLFGIFTVISCLVSCENRVIANFEISNKTNLKIDSLKVEPILVSNGQYISLNPNGTAEYKADMAGIEKIDGSYKLSYQLDGEWNVKDFGYYTNGYSTEKLTRIEIEKDTIMFDAEFGQY